MSFVRNADLSAEERDRVRKELERGVDEARERVRRYEAALQVKIDATGGTSAINALPSVVAHDAASANYQRSIKQTTKSTNSSAPFLRQMHETEVAGVTAIAAMLHVSEDAAFVVWCMTGRKAFS